MDRGKILSRVLRNNRVTENDYFVARIVSRFHSILSLMLDMGFCSFRRGIRRYWIIAIEKLDQKLRLLKKNLCLMNWRYISVKNFLKQKNFSLILNENVRSQKRLKNEVMKYQRFSPNTKDKVIDNDTLTS